jgi:hypothetical protein
MGAAHDATIQRCGYMRKQHSHHNHRLQHARVARDLQIVVAEFSMDGHTVRGDLITQCADHVRRQRGKPDRLCGELALRMLQFAFRSLQRPHLRVDAISRE